MSDYTLIPFKPHSPEGQAILASQELIEIYLAQLEEEFNQALAEVRGLIVQEGGTRLRLTPIGTWIRFSVPHTLLQTAAINQDVEIFSLPPKGAFEAVALKHSVAFKGGPLSAYSLSLGISGDLTRYLPPVDVFRDPGDEIFAANSVLALQSFGSATSIRLAAVSDGAFLNQSTSGSVDIWLKLSRLP